MFDLPPLITQYPCRFLLNTNTKYTLIIGHDHTGIKFFFWHYYKYTLNISVHDIFTVNQEHVVKQLHKCNT